MDNEELLVPGFWRNRHPQINNQFHGQGPRGPLHRRGRNMSQGPREPIQGRGRNTSQGPREPTRGRGRNLSQGPREPANGRGRYIDNHLSHHQRGKTGKREQRPRHVGFLYLEKLAESADTDIIQNVNKQYDALLDLLTSPIDRPDIYFLVLKVAQKVVGCSFDRLKIKFLLDLCNSQFIIYLRTYLMDLPYASDEDRRANKMYWQNPDEFWGNLVAFCECMMTTAPSVAKSKCRSLVEDTSKLCLEKLSENHSYMLPDELSSKLNDLRDAMKIVEEKLANTKKTVVVDQGDPPDDFRELSVLPTREDLLVNKPFIRPNIIDGAYRDVDHYLDVQFRLLREDCFGPLRDGLYQYIKDPSKRRYDNIRIYQDVRFLRPYVSNYKIGTVIQVDKGTTKRFKNVNWSHSQRLKFGTLLLLTKDNCKSFMTVTVMDRDKWYLENGQIPVELLDLNVGDEIYDGESYTMIESEVYFEPYQHVLRALQDSQFPNQLAMKKYIVDVDVQPSRPKYLKHIEEYTYKTENALEDDMTFQPNNDAWPSSDDLGLDESQFEAYKVALTHEFAVIQGPPGTGKTHIGVEIAKTLLWNASNIRVKKRYHCILLLVCYTNHALDQFLEALLPYTDSIARIGGQSRSEELEKYNLSALKAKHRSYTFNDLRNTVNATMSRLMSVQNLMSNAHSGVLRLQLLENDPLPDASINFDEIRNLHDTIYRKAGHRTHPDPMGLWLFEDMKVDYDEIIDETVIVGEVQEYVAVSNSKDDDRQNPFAFSLPEACNEILKMITAYEKEVELAKKVKLQRYIAFLRGQIRLFTRMRELYYHHHDVQSGHARNLNIPDYVYFRWMTYFRWVDHFNEIKNQEMIKIKKEAAQLLKDYEEAKLVIDCEVLREVDVIGMTTTGAARLRKMIQDIGPPIVIVEEAAEVLEQHIITSLTKDCQHLILIGDHKQLRPSAAHMRLARQYNIEVSLFERMILNSVHSRRLRVQHRMRPPFARLLAPHIYPDLLNHPSVEHFPDVRGVTANLFFYTHEHQELAEADSASKSNPKEADMVLLLANYLMQQGYDAKDVTILAAYSGQMFYMKNERKGYTHLDQVKITLVDNYQGEESKIILLSLVRNNHNDSIGFLGTENRICVALSRAREGFYIFGNMNLLKKNSTLWSTIDNILSEDGLVGSTLMLRCENHRENTTEISSAEDFVKVPEGGCLLQCEFRLQCGHQCPLLCHNYGRDHAEIKCDKQCDRQCENEHPCRLKCREPCICRVRMTKKFPCGHENEVPCYVDPERGRCHTELEVTLPLCGHQAKKECWVDIKSVRCAVPCDHRMDPCGHTCTFKCHVNHDPHHEKYKCPKPCARKNNGCSNEEEDTPDEHMCKKLCHEKCDDCNVQVKKRRSTCTHKEEVPCSKDIDKERCMKKCTRKLPCDHFCKKKCWEPCGDCDQMVNKVVAECQHSVRIKCKSEATRAQCLSRCGRALSCGHACERACKEPCDADACAAPAARAIPAACGHDVTPPCAVARKIAGTEVDSDSLLQYCTAPCGAALQCGHTCAGDCGRCLQGRLHVPCAHPCGRDNFCGHTCPEPCSKVCPPCRRQCDVRCMHSKCTQICGAPCASCKEKCGRACVHGQCTRRCGQACTRAPCTERCAKPLACGHACRGFCGEPCPSVCKICKPDDFPRDFLGDEFDDDAIFVLIEDCGHVLHSEDMENLMNGDQETIGVRKCPFCRRAIINTQRYKNTISEMFKKNINPVKRKIYGNFEKIIQTRNELLKDLLDSSKEISSSPLALLKDLVSKPCLRLTLAVKHNKKCDNLQLQMYRTSLNAIKVLADYCRDYQENAAKTMTVRTQFDAAMKTQVEMLSRYLFQNVDKLSVQQQQDYNNELKRINTMINLSRAFDDPTFMSVRTDPTVAAAEREAKLRVLGRTVFDPESADRALKALGEATKTSFNPVKEREMIVRAIGLGPGHWYKCPNGHFYCIGECGGAMQVGTCPECKEKIGGRSHALLPTNRHAGEMDGSPFAAYSEQANNMANFDLNFID
ncbi:NFX1-type zinc finger-containing protein 1-like [Aricia agestis]|uniref:NFX1-type zinc finger-containing protein 1-like n=1 Tax=Aricia agestis TaxID=91739 RepID=UPI001C2055FE|nr:NFX1-type zinc finger-containing protein 1-like [Aricia agestis]XP_041979116.1 NFX1-type zinc finger-containing protein 1-like [Aricia agestis]